MTFNSTPRAILLLICLVLLTQTALADTPVREVIDGVPHVKNGSTPTGGVQALRMNELWRVGGEDDEEILFGLTPKVCTDDKGQVYVLDSQLSQVLVFSPDGKLSHILFREGDGPGEVRQPRDMFVLGDGRVGAMQSFPGTTILVDGKGLPAGRIRAGGPGDGLYSLLACQAQGDHILMSGLTQSTGTPGISNRTFYLSSFGDDGHETHRYCESKAVYDFGNFHYSEREHIPTFLYCFDVGADGRSCVAPDRDAYAIHVFSPDGKPELVLERDYEPIDRSDQEYEELRQTLDSGLSVVPMEYELTVERQAAAIPYFQRGLHMRKDGSIWALSGRGIRELPDGVFAVFDVFDSSGEFVKQMELRGPGNALKDGIFFAGPDRILVVKGYMESMMAPFGQSSKAPNAETDMAVICYQLEK
ncbi:MAG: 6-bladed beta-propeller [Candidatus Krumholzibacteria bacterium]|nr:6-bladed beta-propeller [Candidatus Krumholzibacteria bacterium]